MRNRKKFYSTVCIILVTVLVASLIFSVIGSAMAVSQADINALKNKQATIKEQRSNIQAKIKDLQGQMASVIEQKTALDEQNELARQEIELINEQIALYDKLIEQKALELEEAKADEEKQKEALRVRMRAMEESGNLTYFAILFQACDFSDLLSRIDSISEIMKYDRTLEEAYIAARENVERVKAEYEETQEEQKEVRKELQQKKTQLEQQIEVATAVIESLEMDIEKYEKEFAENQRQEAEIRDEIDKKIAELEAQQKKQQQSGGTVITGSGQFMWPTPSATNVSSGFGNRTHPLFGDTRFHSGIDIGAASGATIVAADAGTVITATYSSSYGNYVVISHGSGNSTLYAHMSSMAVSSGQTVTKGQTIGYVGSTGWSTGPHLHFEIKIGGQLVDPMSQF